MKALRLFEIKEDKLYTLFHGINGSRLVPVGIWLSADKKIVKDGVSGKPYLSGFHAFKDIDPEVFVKQKFRKERTFAVVEVIIEDIYEKPSNKNIILAGRMKVPKEYKIIKIIKVGK